MFQIGSLYVFNQNQSLCKGWGVEEWEWGVEHVVCINIQEVLSMKQNQGFNQLNFSVQIIWAVHTSANLDAMPAHTYRPLSHT